MAVLVGQAVVEVVVEVVLVEVVGGWLVDVDLDVVVGALDTPL